MGVLSKIEFNMGVFTFLRKMKFNLWKRGFIRVVKGGDFYEGDSNT